MRRSKQSKRSPTSDLKKTFVKTSNDAAIKIIQELLARAQLAQTERAEKEMAALRREIASFREENKYLKGEVDRVRKTMREYEAAPVSTPVIPIANREKISSPPPTAILDRSQDNMDRRLTRETNKDPRLYQESDMDMDLSSLPPIRRRRTWCTGRQYGGSKSDLINWQRGSRGVGHA